eukprot:TRINITY_DN52074_c0_g1_i4.p1 TRINITY_DN52074_c0_g1~~TRINITY_DN52074_c0_g1_i4.p1  ORF type:complete len:676 (-),score=1.66 TRINITY_DN52074_c0_g1_i4:116-1966(-)
MSTGLLLALVLIACQIACEAQVIQRGVLPLNVQATVKRPPPRSLLRSPPPLPLVSKKATAKPPLPKSTQTMSTTVKPPPPPKPLPPKPRAKAPPPPLRLTPLASLQQPPWPYYDLRRIPPDVPPPPYPPAPPALRVPNIGTISNIDDVCRICSVLPYDGSCYGDYVSNCLAAMNQLRKNVWKVPDQICDCYSAVASQMIRLCPSVDRRVAYIRNCDSYCFYGARCTFVPTIYSLLSPEYVIASGNTTAASSGTGIAVLDLQPNMTSTAAINFQVQLSTLGATAATAAPAPDILSVGIYNSILGSEGPLTLTLLQQGDSLQGDGSSSLDVDLPMLQRIAIDPFSYYIQVETTNGSMRGQLVFSPHLFSLATSRNVPASCSGSECMAIVDLDISPTNIVYSFAYTNAVTGIIGASVIQGLPGSSGARLFDFFWPGANAPSFTNGVTPPASAIQSLLVSPNAYYITFTSQSLPFGALRGQFQSSMSVSAVLLGSSVVNFPGTTTSKAGSGAAGMAFFNATFASGGICYTFRFTSAVKTTCTYAYLHQGDLGRRGAIYLYQTLQIVPGKVICVSADPDIVAAMALRPQKFYVQAYSVQFPYGALRGQISPDREGSGLARY